MHMAIVTSRVATWEQDTDVNAGCIIINVKPSSILILLQHFQNIVLMSNLNNIYVCRNIHQGEQSSDGDPDDDLLVLVDLVPELGQAALEVVHVLRALRVLDALASLIKADNSIEQPPNRLGG